MLISHPYLITYSFKISIKQLIILIQINFETHYQTQTYLLKQLLLKVQKRVQNTFERLDPQIIT